MAKLTISKMANLYGLSRGALYDKVSKGILTATLNEQGQKVIDMVDMIVLYGEAKTNKAVQVEQQQTVQNSSIQTELDSIELYKKMLEMSENARLKAEQREDRLFNEISSLREELKEFKLVLGYTPYTQKESTEQQPTVQNNSIEQQNHTELNSKNDSLNCVKTPNKQGDIHINKIIEEEPKKRGFWSRFFLPNG
ncbi:hypothetical protein AY606_15395 [Acinetobacter sp. SFB]|uniref:plasmid replication DNA-binding protein n=1 Tax=Acinetobacter sp. SFB TaxID=1805634 RepID=UPI0007D7FF1B|nr:plasmid replication DNA-binding protein [Acinetobacter sp. SFB]OAL80776.1 hypothetical protein AY606_15395 [Acinetobacter sp. SFB]